MTASTGTGDTLKSDEDLLEEYLVDARLQGLSEGTLETYESQIRYYIDWLDTDVRSVGRSELKGFLANLKEERTAMDGSPGLSKSTLNSYFSALNSFYKFLQYERYVRENPIPPFRDRYIESRSTNPGSERQLISIEEMSMLVHSTLDARNRGIIMVLAKTGVRRNELIQIDLDDIDWEEQSIRLKSTPKRTNTVVFFDDECARVLKRWLNAREEEDQETEALFTNQYGERLQRKGVYSAVTKHAEAVGLHDPDSSDLGERFTPHCCRHWFTTHLRRSGMKREFIKELRGDTRGDAIDIYDHIDREELREAYLAHIPMLGV